MCRELKGVQRSDCRQSWSSTRGENMKTLGRTCVALLLLAQLQLYAYAASEDYDIHILFSTECDQYFDWQSIGLVFSARETYKRAGLPPPKITRLMACDKSPPPGVDLVGFPLMHDTHFCRFVVVVGRALSLYMSVDWMCY